MEEAALCSANAKPCLALTARRRRLMGDEASGMTWEPLGWLPLVALAVALVALVVALAADWVSSSASSSASASPSAARSAEITSW